MEFHGCICPKDPKAGTKELTRWDPHGSREMIQRILRNKVPKSLPQTPVLTLYVGLKTFKKSQSYSRRFATATARTASLGSHSRGIETKNIRKY